MKEENAPFKLFSSREEDLDWRLNIPYEEVSDARTISVSGFSGETIHGKDQLNITPDVNAFAGLISSQDLKPPLSIGLFGDWGSGKSFFMGQLRKTINANVRTVQKDRQRSGRAFREQLRGAAAEGSLEEIEGLIHSCLPAPSDQAEQIRLWAKLPDLWARENLLKIYGGDGDKVDQKIAAMRNAPDTATDQIAAQIAEWQETHVEALAGIYHSERVGDSAQAGPIEHLLVRMAESRPPSGQEKAARYCRYVAQIEFNAWHYVDSNLWASLINHIFEALNRYIGNLPVEEREYIQLYRTLENTQEMMREKNNELADIEREISELEETLDLLQAEQAEQRRTLQSIGVRDIWYVLQDQAYIQSATAEVGQLVRTARDLFGINIPAELGVAKESATLERLHAAHRVLEDFAAISVAQPPSAVAVEKALQQTLAILAADHPAAAVRAKLAELEQAVADWIPGVVTWPPTEPAGVPASAPPAGEDDLLVRIKTNAATHFTATFGYVQTAIDAAAAEAGWSERDGAAAAAWRTFHADPLRSPDGEEEDVDSPDDWDNHVERGLKHLQDQTTGTKVAAILPRVKLRNWVQDLQSRVKRARYLVALRATVAELRAQSSVAGPGEPAPDTLARLHLSRGELNRLIATKNPLKKIQAEKVRVKLDKLLAAIQLGELERQLRAELQEVVATLSVPGGPPDDAQLGVVRDRVGNSLVHIRTLIERKDPLAQLDLKDKETQVKLKALVNSFSDSRFRALRAFEYAKRMSPRQRQVFFVIATLLVMVLFVFPLLAPELFSGEGIESRFPRLVALGSKILGVGYAVLDLIPKFIARYEAGMKKLNQGLYVLDQAQTKLGELESRATTELDRIVAAQEQELSAKRQEQQEKIAAVAALRGKAAELEKEKEDIEKGRRFSSFVEKRLESADYKKHLGLISIIRNDFEKLTNYLHHRGQHARFVSQFAAAAAGDSPLEPRLQNGIEQVETIDRIVLYIDDLDRCPPEKVVDVLQAIHLILAFPLFVVVVGVDVRWVSKSLIKKYGTMLAPLPGTNGTDGRQALRGTLDEGAELTLHYRDSATPFDYLEKIFQIPFRLRIMDDGAKRNYIGKLLKDDLVPAEANDDDTPENGSSDPGKPPPVDPGSGKNPMGNGEPPNIAPPVEPPEPRELEEKPADKAQEEPIPELRPISLTQVEYDFVRFLSPVLVGSPRTIKRFVNICRLIKSHEEWGANKSKAKNGAEDSDAVITEYLSLVFVLALINGMPNLASTFFDWLGDAALAEGKTAKTTLQQFVADLQKGKEKETDPRLDRLDEITNEEWRNLYRFLHNEPATQEEQPDIPADRLKAFRAGVRNILIADIDKKTEVAGRFSFRFTRY